MAAPTRTRTTAPTVVAALETAARTPTANATANATAAASATATHTPTSGPRPTLGPEDWQQVPVIPTGVSQRVRLIYEMGLLKGNDPHAYTKVGDCNVTNPYFMTDFDTPGSYTLGDYAALQSTIDYFPGSHARVSLAAKQGLTAHAVLSMLWNTWEECDSYETPLTCEYRLQRPLFAIVSFGTNDANGSVDFEKALRRVIDMTIGNGTIPILVTKADNAEGDNSFNRIIVDLAYEYELPIWNYWLAVQPIPGHGLLDAEHAEHLSVGPRGYMNFTAENLPYGWSMRNLTGLQTLDAMRKALDLPEE